MRRPAAILAVSENSKRHVEIGLCLSHNLSLAQLGPIGRQASWLED